MAQARVPRSERLGADVAEQSLGRAAGAQPLSMDRGRGACLAGSAAPVPARESPGEAARPVSRLELRPQGLAG